VAGARLPDGEIIELEPDGAVAVPAKPGLGLDIDWERMDALTVVRL
jgi:L-alanine-DL-glutamate epimerase-like enolase superfamily enzyme